MGGSHINYIDYDRAMLKDFMAKSVPASSMVSYLQNCLFVSIGSDSVEGFSHDFSFSYR